VQAPFPETHDSRLTNSMKGDDYETTVEAIMRIRKSVQRMLQCNHVLPESYENALTIPGANICWDCWETTSRLSQQSIRTAEAVEPCLEAEARESTHSGKLGGHADCVGSRRGRQSQARHGSDPSQLAVGQGRTERDPLALGEDVAL
jgi:hypothetical protein